jgi:hypothetical protein
MHDKQVLSGGIDYLGGDGKKENKQADCFVLMFG